MLSQAHRWLSHHHLEEALWWLLFQLSVGEATVAVLHTLHTAHACIPGDAHCWDMLLIYLWLG